MSDGLYICEHDCGIRAGFVIEDGIVVKCAPILRKKFAWWRRRALWLCE